LTPTTAWLSFSRSDAPRDTRSAPTAQEDSRALGRPLEAVLHEICPAGGVGPREFELRGAFGVDLEERLGADDHVAHCFEQSHAGCDVGGRAGELGDPSYLPVVSFHTNRRSWTPRRRVSSERESMGSIRAKELLFVQWILSSSAFYGSLAPDTLSVSRLAYSH
jgi:hypothetical protein